MKPGIRFARTIKVALLCAWACGALAQNSPQPQPSRPNQKILNRADAAFYTGRKQERLSHWDSASSWYGKALALYRSAHSEKDVGIALHALGMISDAQGHRERALEFFAEALAAESRAHDASGGATTLAAMAKVYDDLGQMQSALD